MNMQLVSDSLRSWISHFPFLVLLPCQQNLKAYLGSQKSLLGPVRPGNAPPQNTRRSCILFLGGVWGENGGVTTCFPILIFRYVAATWTPTQPLSPGPAVPSPAHLRRLSCSGNLDPSGPARLGLQGRPRKNWPRDGWKGAAAGHQEGKEQSARHSRSRSKGRAARPTMSAGRAGLQTQGAAQELGEDDCRPRRPG